MRKLWDFDKPYRHPGVELGTATQIGISLGVALAHNAAGPLVVDIQPDGDLMFDAGALWVAAKHKIPMLIVMHNNRAYYNDWEHQIRMARLRGTDEAKAHIGMDLYGPEPDFARPGALHGLLRRRPDRQAADMRPALERALAEVKKGRLGAGGYDHAAPLNFVARVERSKITGLRMAITMTTRAVFLAALGVLAQVMMLPAPAAAQDDGFYRGKTITIIIPIGPGGAYDAYARLVSRHLGKHLPGNPTIIARNMPGAGGVIASNYVYNVAPQDGTTSRSSRHPSPTSSCPTTRRSNTTRKSFLPSAGCSTRPRCCSSGTPRRSRRSTTC